MAQSSKAAGRGQRRGRNVSSHGPSSTNLSLSAGGSAPSVSSEAIGASMPSINLAAVAKQQAKEKKYPLWKYVTRKEGPGSKSDGGGNVLWSCNFCKGQFKSTYYRVKGHLLGLPCGLGACPGISFNQRKELEKEDAVGLGNVAATSKKKSKHDDPLPFLRNTSSRFGSGSEIQPTKKRAAQSYGPMDKIFQQETRQEVDLTVAFFFYLNFISFNVARSPLFIEMCRSLVEKAPSGYVPPSSEKLRTSLLFKAKKEVDIILEPIKTSWLTSGVSIVSDGWTDTARHPIINFMVSSHNGPVFLKAVDALGKYKDAQYMGELFIKIIEDVGVESCVQMITDNAPVCKAAGMIVEAKYPQIFWTPCIVHSLNLALKSIASDVPWIGSVIEDARYIRNFVQNHTNALTIYKEHTHLSLLKIADTRFASSFIMLKRLREVKAALGAMVISDFWSFWRKTDQIASKKVKETVLDDGWWERVNVIIKIMEPIISLLRFADTDHPILGDVYEGWDSMIESVKTIVMENDCTEYGTSSESLWSTIQDILISRWDKNCTPLHCLAHSLNPKYYTPDWLRGGPSHRFPPHMDLEISNGRKIALRRIFQDTTSLAEAEEGFIEFSTGSGRFGGYDVLRDRGVKKAHGWWATHGAACPLLQQLAMRILSQVTSSSCCERNWSTYGNLYSLKKSRLEQSRAETMVYVHSNLRLIYRKRQEWMKGKTKMWDVFPDDMGLDNTVELALANMDLNDPVLEPVTFDDEPNEGSSATPEDVAGAADLGLGTEDEEDDGEESSDNNDGDFDMELEDY